MSELKEGDRVTVRYSPYSQSFDGLITGEGRDGLWWWVLKDGTKHPRGIHKSFCQRCAVTSTDRTTP
jgi:hypothetical protein